MLKSIVSAFTVVSLSFAPIAVQAQQPYRDLSRICQGVIHRNRTICEVTNPNFVMWYVINHENKVISIAVSQEGISYNVTWQDALNRTYTASIVFEGDRVVRSTPRAAELLQYYMGDFDYIYRNI